MYNEKRNTEKKKKERPHTQPTCPGFANKYLKAPMTCSFSRTRDLSYACQPLLWSSFGTDSHYHFFNFLLLLLPLISSSFALAGTPLAMLASYRSQWTQWTDKTIFIGQTRKPVIITNIIFIFIYWRHK